MPNYICITCGNQYAALDNPPPRCLICDEERQYVNPLGQSWALHKDLLKTHRNQIRTLEPGLSEIETAPKLAIGQRALLIQTSKGNVLWDCLSIIDKATIKEIEGLGGISALAMPHPHMFGSMVEWSHAFGNAPIYLHADYEKWVQRPDRVINYWDGESIVLEQGPSLHRTGGHFKGQTILFWPHAADGKGAILSSDALYVTADRKFVGFMYSYPNYIPLSPAAVTHIAEVVLPLKFDRIYSHFRHRQILLGGKGAIENSVERYLGIVQS